MKPLISFMLVIFSFVAFAQTTDETFRFYLTTSKFLKNQPGTKAEPKIKRIEHDYVQISRVKHSSLVKKDRASNYPWAVMLDSNFYFNLRYCFGNDLNDIYVLGEIIDKYVIFVIDDSTSKVIRNATNYHFAYSGDYEFLVELALLAINPGISKNCSKWITKNKGEVRILISNTEKWDLKSRGHINAQWYYLTCKNFNYIVDSDFTKEEIEKLYLDDIFDLLRKQRASE